MIYGSVCSGIEAATVAWHPLGWRPAFYSEIEAFPRAVLAHHYPDVPLHGDFTTIEAGQYADIDVLVGGTPCQSFSVAGLRAGLADDRGNLALEYLRLAQRLRPRWLVWENVPGVLSSNGGRDFGAILGGLGELGYGFAYRVLDAQYIRVDGYERAVPQRRRRVFLIGYLGDWRPAAAVLFERESLRGHSTPRRQAGEGIAGTVTSRAGNGSRPAGGNGNIVAKSLNAHAGGRYDYETETETETLVAHSLRASGFDASEDGTGRGTPLVPVATGFYPTAGQDFAAHEECSPSVKVGSGGSSGNPPGVAIGFQTRGSNLDVGEHVTGTIGSNADRASGSAPMIAFSCKDYGNDAHPLDTDGFSIGVQRGWQVRRLTPTECERLQGFPDGYTAVPYRGKPAADGPRYKALGNSKAINAVRWVGKRIQIVDQMLKELAA